MNATHEMKALLFEELDLIVRTTAGLVRRIPSDQWEYRPIEQMRTLRELVEHLVAVPSVDLLILQEKTEADIRQLEAKIAELPDQEALIEQMVTGTNDLKAYMEGLSDEDFLQKKTKPFYLEHGTVQAKWLIEIVTHAQHHRAQLFTYLKQLGHEVNMFDLY
ncbi:DinB family protein [Brevibacillus ruminantium]|uniref:DinB family protein n=1 Tax=Brevibacillus ruminantium TaxID=2950604 RepID=A0ABY4WFL1_9BACL|nr:DinB family protein [Brevibacillus ruminantium]USG65857.1 DinB family protein [Brevibacillus ruminantium]